MFSTTLITVALAGAATAFTPQGFQPASQKDLAVGFNGGKIAAINGVNLPQAETTTQPAIGTTERLTGTYTLMMVDMDIPPSTPGGQSTELLHWMQTDLSSANTTSEIGGQKVFALTNAAGNNTKAANTSTLAAYLPPNPPNVAPTSHRYVQMLIDTTNLQTKNNLTSLMRAAATRTNFSAANVLKANGLTVLMGNSFNVTNAAALASNSTGVSGGAGSSNSSGQGVAGGAGGAGATGGATSSRVTSSSGVTSTSKVATATAAGGVGPNGINSATLTTDALLKTGFSGSAAAQTTPAAAATTAKAAATGPINSATLTTDVLISTGGAQAQTAGAGVAASSSRAAAPTHGAANFMAGIGAFAVAVAVL